MKTLKKLAIDLIFPLKILIFGLFLQAISTFIKASDITAAYAIINQIADLTGYVGTFIFESFPLMVLLRLLNRRYNDYISVLLGFISYVTIHVTTMIFAPTTLQSYVFDDVLGIRIYYTSGANQTVSKFPIQMGLIATILCFAITTFVIDNYRRRGIGFFSFFDKESLNIIMVVLLTIVAGVAVSFSWRYFIGMIGNIQRFVADDISNPFRLMVYNIVEKIFDILWLPNLIRTPFWYGEAGGSYVNSYGQKIIGDIPMWTAQVDIDSIIRGVGRFITSKYVFGLFAIPGYILGVHSVETSKQEKWKQIPVVLIILLLVIMTGNTLVADIYMLITIPFFFIFYLICIGVVSIITGMTGAFVGHYQTGDTLLSNPGNVFEFIRYGGEGKMQSQVYVLIIIGIILFILFYVLTKRYFKVASIKPKTNVNISININQLIAALGGVANISEIDASASKITVKVDNRRNVDVEKIRELGASGIVENRNGFNLIFGRQSAVIRDEILKHQKEYKDESNEIEVHVVK